MSRTLRSKKLRNLLYYSQSGKCANCGCDLPDDWHADHIIPYVVTHRTNVHDMQALCPTCNWEKGSKMLRKHQIEMSRIVSDIRNGMGTTDILAYVTPGGGKSAFAMIIAKELAEPLGCKICWVVPRDNLRSQGESDFVDRVKIVRFGHNSKIRAAGNDIRPSRDNIGYVTTYQAIAAQPQLHFDEFRTQPYILILDECHHIPYKGEGSGDEAKYYSAIEPLCRQAFIRVYASGTLERHDGHKIAFLPYKEFINSEAVDLSPRPGWEFIRYTRKDALEEGAVVPLHFYVMDGQARWFDPKTGVERDVNSIAESQLKDQPAVLQTVLETDYAYQLLDKCSADWNNHKAYNYPSAKMLVVAPNIEIAKQYQKHLGDNSLLATSDDSPAAKDNIERFKRGRDNILVTVGMAYEGLDVPEITHVACLTNIRSRPWIEQCICRANRTAAGKTHGYIYYPDDPRMQSIMKKIDAEQIGLVMIQSAPVCGGGGGGYTPGIGPVPIVSGATRSRAIGQEDGTMVDWDETGAMEEAARQANIVASVVQIKQMLTILGVATIPNGNGAMPDYSEPVLTPSELEKRLDKSIDITVKRVAKGNPDTIKLIYSDLKNRYGTKSITTVATKQTILRYLNDKYGAVL